MPDHFDLKSRAYRLIAAQPVPASAILRFVPEDRLPRNAGDAGPAEILAMALARESLATGRPVDELLEFHSDALA